MLHSAQLGYIVSRKKKGQENSFLKGDARTSSAFIDSSFITEAGRRDSQKITLWRDSGGQDVFVSTFVVLFPYSTYRASMNNSTRRPSIQPSVPKPHANGCTSAFALAAPSPEGALRMCGHVCEVCHVARGRQAEWRG